MVTAVQDLGRDARVVGEPLGREDRQAIAPRDQETLAGERVQDTGVAEACGVAHRDDRRTNVEVVAVCLRQGVDRTAPSGSGGLAKAGSRASAWSSASVLSWSGLSLFGLGRIVGRRLDKGLEEPPLTPAAVTAHNLLFHCCPWPPAMERSGSMPSRKGNRWAT